MARQKRVVKPPPPLEPRPMKDLDALLDRMTPDDWETVRNTATPEMMEELQAMLARHEFRKTQLRLYSYYPETGPLRRELYHKHMEFYAAGAIHQERALIAANRCLTVSSTIETEFGERLVGELLKREGPFKVKSWGDHGGYTYAETPGLFVKGVEPVVRVRLDNGAAFETTMEHQVLTVEGWHSVGTVALHPWAPALIGGRHFLEVTVLSSKQPVYDLTVPATGNYVGAGIVHHNSGKSFCVSYEAACHMIGWYPDWWVGRRFDHPVVTWFAGEDAKAVRDSLQIKMLGNPDALGTGMIPFDNIIGKPTSRAGVAEAVDTFNVVHRSGGISRGRFLTYDMGREAFQAATVDVLVLDEEPPMPIYSEGLTRLMATEPSKQNGILMAAFTPIRGLSQVVLMYLPGGKMEEPKAR